MGEDEENEAPVAALDPSVVGVKKTTSLSAAGIMIELASAVSPSVCDLCLCPTAAAALPAYPSLPVDATMLLSAIPPSALLSPDHRFDALVTHLLEAEFRALRPVFSSPAAVAAGAAILPEAWQAGAATFTTSLRKHHFMFPKKYLQAAALVAEGVCFAD